MRVPLGWLADFVELPDDIEALARRLTFAGLEVSAIERTGGSWERVVTGSVLEVAPHPNADRLRLVSVDHGDGRTTVVCGAPNVAAGQTIAFAKEGAVLADARTGAPRKLKKSRIRGVVSAGMVCSEAELGLGASHEGILVLETDAAPGAPLGDVLGDRVLVFDLTPNRADALSVMGVAREVAALTGAALRPPAPGPEPRGPDVAGRATAEILAPDLCARFTLALIEGLEIGPSPDWMQKRLSAAGMRPINNLVDVTNYAMLETGQPVHAFDYDRVRDHRIIVRRAEAGESLVTLDGQTRSLTPDRLVIADPGGPVALAGVMGGIGTEVTKETGAILLEAACFHPASVRRSARAFDLFSDAARRFAWGVPPELASVGSERVRRLLGDHAGGVAASGMVDVWPVRTPPARITLPVRRIAQVLGASPGRRRAAEALSGLGFRVQDSGDALEVEAPYSRRDIRVPDDLVEEVARVVGYDDLPALPMEGAIPHRLPVPPRRLRERVRDLSAAAGLREVQTYSLVSEPELARVVDPGVLAEAKPFRVLAPLSAERDRLRVSMRSGIFRAAALNLDRGARAAALFEVGRVYLRPAGAPDQPPEERERAIGLLVGSRPDRWGRPTGESLDFFDAKGTLEHVLSGLGVSAAFRPLRDDAFGLAPGRAAEVVLPEGRVGVLGQVARETAEAFGIDADVFLWELRLTELLEARPALAGPALAEPVSRHPEALEDLALLVGEDVLAGDVVADIQSHPLVVGARVFDDYRFDGEAAGPGRKAGARSLGVEVRCQARDRTLTEADLAKIRRALLKRLKANHGAVLREA